MEELAEGERIVTVNIYDAHASNANFKVKPTTTAADICKIILSKRDILSSESRFFSIVLVISAFNSFKKCDTHCLRTLKPEETFFDVQRTIITKMASKYGQSDESKLESGSKWYFKDMRTNPIELGAAAEICGEYSSDEDEAISQSDLSYLAKSERKGYLLKRSNSDFNLWRRWYCVLMDQLWCVDISREVPRAKCVKLSGMIRYREGYKTLDQLQIIIINSPDSKSHFFRAFNLIDQRKWIQDLNIKTRVAAENDSFSMAEVIITDEEDAKNFRLTRQIGEVLDQPKAIEALAFRSAADFMPNDASAQNNLSRLIMDEGANLRFSEHSQKATNGVYCIETPATTPRKGLADPTQLISPMQSPSGKNNSFVRIKQNINDPIAAAPVIISEDFGANETTTPLTEEEAEQAIVALAGRNVSVTECTRFTHPRPCSCVNLQNLEICERVENHCLMHELHKDSRSVTEVLLFVIAVQKYKEILRRELYMPLKRQQTSALRLYVKFILPQLLFTDLAPYPDFSDESMQLNSAAGTDVDSKETKNKNSSSTSGKYGAESPKRPRNRSQSQVPPEAAASAPRNEIAAVQWHIDTGVLMRVHEALFAMHTRTVELRNALVTQDPSQLVKYGAGSSKFRARDRSVSTAHISNAAGLSVSTTAVAASSNIAAPASPVPAPAGSFWPWFGFGGPSPNITPPPSRKGSDAQALAAAASAKESAAAAIAQESTSTSNKVSPVGTTISVEKEKSEESKSEKNSSVVIPPSPAATPSPQQTNGKSMSQKCHKESVVSVGKSEEKTEKSPSAELFDEVVAALLQKLN